MGYFYLVWRDQPRGHPSMSYPTHLTLYFQLPNRSHVVSFEPLMLEKCKYKLKLVTSPVPKKVRMLKEIFSLLLPDYTAIDLIDLINRRGQNNRKSIET